MIIVEKKGNCTIFNISGVVTANEILTKAIEYVSGEQTDTALWDFTKATHADLKTIELKGITDSLKKVENDGKVRKVALVASKTINIGLGKFFVAMAQMSNLQNQYKAFRSIHLAKEWLEDRSTE